MGGSAAETIRQPRDRLRGQPQERQHSAAARRDAGPTAPGEGCLIFNREYIDLVPARASSEREMANNFSRVLSPAGNAFLPSGVLPDWVPPALEHCRAWSTHSARGPVVRQKGTLFWPERHGSRNRT
jgi:hypothetical protein